MDLRERRQPDVDGDANAVRTYFPGNLRVRGGGRGHILVPAHNGRVMTDTPPPPIVANAFYDVGGQGGRLGNADYWNAPDRLPGNGSLFLNDHRALTHQAEALGFVNRDVTTGAVFASPGAQGPNDGTEGSILTLRNSTRFRADPEATISVNVEFRTVAAFAPTLEQKTAEGAAAWGAAFADAPLGAGVNSPFARVVGAPNNLPTGGGMGTRAAPIPIGIINYPMNNRGQ